ncbi:MAG: SOS response-associated peptidase family protein, partial [Candidatus Binatia bacterium]
MCTLYSQVKTQAEIRALINAIYDTAGNLGPQPAIFPDTPAPVVRETDKGRELTKMRWGVPGPAIHGGRLLFNVRNVASGFWKPYLKVKRRCLVPATSFCEYADNPDPKTKKKIPTWFAISKERPLFFFAGIYREFEGARGHESRSSNRQAFDLFVSHDRTEQDREASSFESDAGHSDYNEGMRNVAESTSRR